MAVQFCIVCGRGSDRTWNNVNGPYVACDFHSLPEFLGAIANLTKPAGAGDTNQDPAVDESQGA